MIHKFAVVVLLTVSFLLTSGFSPQPRPSFSDDLQDPRFVCREDDFTLCNPSAQRPNGRPIFGQLVSYSDYIEQVLSNEWHSGSDIEAFKAGTVAIRTFANRELGCGAKLPYTYGGWPGYLMNYNGSQRYWLGSDPNWYQSSITSNHQSARDQTDGVYLNRDDGTSACAKYFANTGNPTHSCYGGSSHGQCPYNSSDQSTLKGVTESVASNNYVSGGSYPGMSQNGSAAWVEGNAPWDYRQILTHYYRKTQLAGSSSSYYRWAWLNVGNDIEFTGFPGSNYEEYYGTTNPTPDCLYIGGGAPVSLRIQNTSRQDWNSNTVKLSYRWYDGSTHIDTGPEVNLPYFDQSDDNSIVATLYPPSGAIAGQSYTLKWDLKRGSTWFSSQNNWPTLNSSVCMLTDNIPPNNPPQGNISSPSGHVQNDWSGQTQVSLTWSGAQDEQTGVSGYSITWNQNQTSLPDTTQDTTNSTATSNLGHGDWYLHVRTKDNAENWAGSATHYGPYGVDTTPPTSQASNNPVTPGKSWLYLNVSGSDAGAGIAHTKVQYKVDSGAWQDYATVNGAGPHTLLFTLSRYNRGHTYSFRTQATDQIGLVETVGAADFSIYIAPDADPSGLLDYYFPIIFK